MTYFDKKWFKILRIVRVVLYIILFTTFIVIDTSYFIEHKSICPIANKFNLLCPSCGVTRAFSSIMHFKFKNAYLFNPVFTVAVAPICIFLFLDDSIRTIVQLFTKKYQYSILEYLVFGLLN